MGKEGGPRTGVAVDLARGAVLLAGELRVHLPQAR
jgi:hypothetical protein